MKTFTHTLSGLLLATTALFAPHAFAQDAVAAQDEDVDVQEVVVRGRFIPEPMRGTSEVAAFLTTEDLVRQGDDNAAQALTRVTGLSIVEGRFIYVRGLGERYSSALLNGSPLPSPEPLQRVVPLDLFPSSILQSVAVQKTYSPQYWGEFGGGVIDLRTVAAPAQPFLTMGVSVGANSETTFKGGFTHYGSDTDPLGFDNGTRDMPGLLRDAIATGKRVNQGNFSADEIQAIGQSFENARLNLVQKSNNIPANWGLNVAGGRAFDLGDVQLGLIGVFEFDNDWRTRNGVQQGGRVELGQLVVRDDYQFSSTQNDVGWNLMGGLGLEFGPDHTLRWTNLYIRRTSKETRVREGYDDFAGFEVLDHFTAWYERELASTQLRGDHRFGEAWTLNWRGAYAETTRNAPYEKSIRYGKDADGYFHDASRVQNRTDFSELTDTVKSGGAELTYTLPLSARRDAIFGVGFDHMKNERESETRAFRFRTPNQPLPLEVQRTRVDYLFADYNIRSDRLVLEEVTGSDGAAAYAADLTVDAAFLRADVEVIPLVRFAAGVRYEDGKQQVRVRDLFDTTGNPFSGPAPLENSYWLPAATVTWNFADDMHLRLGASKTIGRPQFRELAPQQYLDPDSDRFFVGNPYLRDTELTNYDARWEWYFERGQYLTAGAFYKDIQRPIETTVTESGAGLLQTYLNAPKAVLYGLEFEAKKLWDSPFQGVFWDTKRWLVQANYTWTQSEVQVSDGDVVFPLAAGGSSRPAKDFILDGARMQGQSEHVANLQFGWDDREAQSQATLLVTYVGERSSARGRPGEPDIVQEPGVMLDFVWRKGFTAMNRDLTFGLEARNLLNTEFQEYQQLGARIDINRYDLGRGLSISLTAKF